MESSVPTGSGRKPITQWEAMGFVWELLFVIAVPTLLLALAGRYADRHWHITPWGTVIGLLLSFAISGYLVVKRGGEMAARMKTVKKDQP